MTEREAIFSRTELLLGAAALEKLQASRVAVCGLGGVGSYVAEALVRSGIGGLVLADFDRVAPSNLNRQLCALRSTMGRLKAEVMAERCLDINPDCQISLQTGFIDAGFSGWLPQPDYIADAIDYLPGKVALVKYASAAAIPILCATGAGWRLDLTRLAVADISKSHTCPLARRLRKALKEAGISQGVKVAFSAEQPVPAVTGAGEGRAPIGSAVFVPAAMGLLMAAEIVREISHG